MKPAIFEYHDPRQVDELLDLLADLGEDGKVLAGGQSLVPLMNFRLARPANIVDLNRVAGLDMLGVGSDGALTIGAMVRQRTLERSTEAARGWPLLVDAVRNIGHVQIRTRGTIGGSVAHADPAAELPAVMAALDATFVVRKKSGERETNPDAFFLTYLTTTLEPDELLAEIRVPPLPGGTGWSFQEISRRHGDFALVGVATLLTLDQAGAIERARLAFTGAAATPIRAGAAEQALVGQQPSEAVFREVAALAAKDLDPPADIHASSEYRYEVAQVLARRALLEAAGRAGGKAA